MNMLEIFGLTYPLDVPRQIDFDFFHLCTGKLQGDGFPVKLIGALFKNAQCILEHGYII
jgi:hypothetical protein